MPTSVATTRCQSMGVSVQVVSVKGSRGPSAQGSLSKGQGGGLCIRGLCPGRVSVQGGRCPKGVLLPGVSVQGGLCLGDLCSCRVSVQGIFLQKGDPSSL